MTDRFQALVEHVADGLVVIDGAGFVKFANPAAGGMFGRDPEQLCDREFGFATTIGKSTEIDILRRDGTAIVAEMRVNEIAWDDQPAYLAAIRDITVRKKIERAVAESESRFRSVIESAAHGIALVELSGDLISANRALELILHAPDDTLRARSIFDFVHPEMFDTLSALFNSLANGSANRIQSEIRLVGSDDKTIHALITVGVVQDEYEQPSYGVAQIVDISDLKRSEEQLRQAQKVESLGHLTGGIAHDFNNILGIILSNLQLAQKRGDGDERLSKQLGRALKATQRGVGLTRGLLAFGRRQVLDAQPTDVNDLVGDLIEIVSGTLGPRIEIRFEPYDGRPIAMVDHTQLQNALINLSVNARDAMPDGGTLIFRVQVVASDQDENSRMGRRILIEVEDSGTGMPKEVQEKLFEPFYTTKDAGKGTGLGMSAVLGFAQQSGGHVGVWSEEGVGTRISLYIPKAETEDRDHAGADHDRPSDALPNGSETVLLVDDEEAILEALEDFLTQLGYTIFTATRADRALGILEARDDIDLIFTDYSMPGGMTGLELATAIRARKPGAKVILFSAYSRSLHGAAQTEPGVRFLQKPATNQTIAFEIRSVLDGSRGAPAPHPS